MQLDLVLQYLRARSYERSTIQRTAAQQLTEAITEFGIQNVRKEIRSQFGECPHIVPLLHDALFFFKKYVSACSIDDERGYVLTRYTNNANLTLNGYDNWGSVWYTHAPELIQGQTLRNWIALGQECTCGTPFISYNTLDTECPQCLSRYQTKEYSYKVEDDLGFEATKEICFGIELEYEGVTAKDVGLYLKGHALAKRDGSISKGVEVVTRPACIATHKEKLKKFYANVKTKAYSNTGMHVHVDKARLSNYQIGFMLQFLNQKALVEQLHVVAGRHFSSNTYCRSKPEHKMTYRTTNYHVHGVKETQKYSPLNTSKPKTVEVRIFSSPTSHLECSAKLDFVAALVKYASPYSVSVKTLKDKFKWNTFYKFMVDNKKEFPDFHEFFIKSSKLSLEAA